ncbi:RNA polymerase sigma factor SigJ, partial [Altericroceibacterium endophyticum]
MPPERILQTFEKHRPRLRSLAYRMTGSLTDSEDILQETWMRWSTCNHDSIRDPARWLTTITARQCLDHLNSARMRRERYVGAWLPDPLISGMAPDAETLLSEGEDVRIALLLMLQSLSPPMRAAFLLREAFDFSYAEIAAVTGDAEASARQLVSRARKRMAGAEPECTSSTAEEEALVHAFWQASRTGDMDQLLALFAEDIEVYTDGGGRVPASLNVLHGAWRAAALFAGLARKSDRPSRPCPPLLRVNGSPGFVSVETGDVLQTTALAI